MARMMLGADARDAGWRWCCWFRLPERFSLETFAPALCLGGLFHSSLLARLFLRWRRCAQVHFVWPFSPAVADYFADVVCGRLVARSPLSVLSSLYRTRQARPLLGLGMPLTLPAPLNLLAGLRNRISLQRRVALRKAQNQLHLGLRASGQLCNSRHVRSGHGATFACRASRRSKPSPLQRTPSPLAEPCF